MPTSWSSPPSISPTEHRCGRAGPAVRAGTGGVRDRLRPGDTLYVWKLDRFARSLIDLVTMVDAPRERGVGFRVLTGALASINPNTPDGRLMLQVVRAMAEFERSLIKDHTHAGLAAAKAQGRTGGRPAVMDADKLAAAKARRARGESVTEVAKASGVSR
ncbi:recombinase family protein, partial [Streptomyces qinzhouensis]|uniref:recombinase family protein n=1 Tax=Streptomyces qinzhouensis TaxID=2599401 RepID=UPI0011B83A1E